jgi:hypothetical protein
VGKRRLAPAAPLPGVQRCRGKGGERRALLIHGILAFIREICSKLTLAVLFDQSDANEAISLAVIGW